MPEISRFYGIVDLMYFADHDPPHFHARYGGRDAKYSVDGQRLDGSLPLRTERVVRAWTRLHREDLRECWAHAERHEAPGRIDPLP